MVLFDVSFQLSALSMAGIVILYPLLRDSATVMMEKTRNKLPSLDSSIIFVSESLSMTLAATLAVWPASAVYFGTVSLAAPFATLFAVPVLPFIMVLGSLMGFAGFLYFPLALVTGWVVWLFASYLLLVVNIFSKIPHSAVATGDISRILIWAYYGLVVVLAWIIIRRRRVQFMAEMSPAAAE
jgi:competence protein ComEC